MVLWILWSLTWQFRLNHHFVTYHYSLHITTSMHEKQINKQGKKGSASNMPISPHGWKIDHVTYDLVTRTAFSVSTFYLTHTFSQRLIPYFSVWLQYSENALNKQLSATPCTFYALVGVGFINVSDTLVHKTGLMQNTCQIFFSCALFLCLDLDDVRSQVNWSSYQDFFPKEWLRSELTGEKIYPYNVNLYTVSISTELYLAILKKPTGKSKQYSYLATPHLLI